MRKKIIYFDIDETLINTTKFNSYLLKSLYTNVNFKDCLYENVESILERLKEDSILGIFSQGFKGIQLAKLKLTKIDKYFDSKEIYIKPFRKTNIINKFANKDNILFIDNDANITKALNKCGFKTHLVLKDNENNNIVNL